MRSRFLWTDGHTDTHEVDPTADEIKIVGEDGRPHSFSAAGGEDAEGLLVFIEESREWERFHRNGRRAVVYQHADLNPGRYSAGAPQRGAATGFETNIGALDQAKRIADEASGCPQPCECPPWSD